MGRQAFAGPRFQNFDVSNEQTTGSAMAFRMNRRTSPGLNSLFSIGPPASGPAMESCRCSYAINSKALDCQSLDSINNPNNRGWGRGLSCSGTNTTGHPSGRIDAGPIFGASAYQLTNKRLTILQRASI